MKKYLIVATYSLIFNIATIAQIYNFDFLTVKDGIPQSQVNAVCEDTLGNLWVGTMYGGLCVYNGEEFYNFYHQSAFDETRMRDLVCAKDGKVYAATDHGLFVFDGLEKNYPDSSNNGGLMWQIAEDVNGVLWIASEKGLLKYENDKIETISQTVEIGFKESVYFVFAGNDRVFYEYNGNLAFLKGDSTGYFRNDLLGNVIIHNGLQAKDGTIWVATNDGLYCFKENEVEVFRIDDGLISNNVKHVIEDKNGRIWIAYEEPGLSMYDGNNLTSIYADQGIGANLIDEMFVDSQNRLWVGLDGGGVASFGGFQFYHYDLHFENARSNLVMAVLVDSQNNKWFGTDASGLIKFDGRNYQLFNMLTNLPSNSINDIQEDSEGNIWIGTTAGLCKYKDGEIERVQLLGNNEVEVLSIFIDGNDDIYLGTMNKGAFLIAGNNITQYTKEDGLAEIVVWDIFKKSSGEMFFATNKGFSILNDGKFKNYTESNGLANNSISTILEDKENNIWIATDYGLSFFDGTRFKNYSIDDGLLSNVIYAMELDSDSNLWLGTDKGMNKLIYDNGGNIIDIKSFAAKEGFTSIECNHNAIDVDKDGLFWIGTINGVTVCNPDIIKENNPNPIIYISGLKLFHKEVNWSEYSDSLSGFYKIPYMLSLPFAKNNLSFEYNCVDLNGTESLLYTFILDGLEKEWSTLANNKVASYANIPPGDYVFKVKALTRNGTYTPTTSFKFTIKKPYWQQLWFYSLLVFVLIAIIYFFIKQRTRKLEKSNKNLEVEVKKRTAEIVGQNEKLEKALRKVNEAARFKESFIANTSHEMRTPLNAIIGFTNLLLTLPENTRLKDRHIDYLKSINKSGKSLLVFINDILDFSKIEAGKLSIEKTTFDVREAVQNVVSTLNIKAKEKQILFDYKIDENIPRNLIGDPHRVSQVLMNLTSNAIKFTNLGGKVSLYLSNLKLSESSCFIEFAVVDNGIGIKPEKLDTIFDSYKQAEDSTARNYGGTGLGLAIVKNLVELMDGEIDVESELGKGSKFAFRLSFEKAFDIPAKDNLDSFDYNLYECHPAKIDLLIVEDNQLNLKLAREMINTWETKVEIDTAENGKQAFEKVKNNSYHIVLMDLQMPEMDGYQAIEQIRTMLPEPKNRTPIVAISAHAMQHEKDRCFALGVNEYAVKPFYPESIYKIIKFYSCSKVYKQIMNGGSVNIMDFKCAGKLPVEKFKAVEQKTEKKPMVFSYIDLRNLYKMNAGDEKRMRDLLESYLEVVPQQFDVLLKSLNDKDWKRLSDIAHSIKPSMFYLGLNTLFDNMKIIEEIIKNSGDKEKITGFVHESTMYWKKAEVEIKKYIEN